MYNSAELLERIKSSGVTKTHIAKSLNITEAGLYKKLNGNSEFKASEIQTLACVLNLNDKQLRRIFFSN